MMPTQMPTQRTDRSLQLSFDKSPGLSMKMRGTTGFIMKLIVKFSISARMIRKVKLKTLLK